MFTDEPHSTLKTILCHLMHSCYSSSLFFSGRDDAIAALKQSVKLDNPSDWQLLIELTSQATNAASAAATVAGGGTTSTNTTAGSG